MTSIKKLQQQDHTRARGRSAEDDGTLWLESQGLRIVDRNVEYRAGELDVVALEGETLCFVEIKARATNRFGEAVWAVTQRKQRKIAAAAMLYLATHEHEGPCRFDVLAMDGGPGGWRYTFLRDAFQLE